MARFSIIGTGKMGNAIGAILAAGGSAVSHLSHDEIGSAALGGDVVILAVPHPALEGILAAYAEQLAGRIVVDITNPLNFETFDSLVVPAGSSMAAQLQERLPDSRVLKAFNVNFAATLVSKQVGGRPTTVLIAGDDAEAKQVLAAAVEAGGVRALDAGGLSRAHELEAMGFLQITLAAAEKIAWSGGFAVL